MNKFIKIFATGFGTGYAPFAPGTAGTIVGVVFFWALMDMSVVHYVIFLGVFILLASWVADKAQILFGKKDPKQIVIDEIAGILVTFAGHEWNWKVVVIGFLLFRLFDIVKPFPIRRIEQKLSNGFGVVLDDVLAGIYANICLAGLAGLASLTG